MKSNITSRYLVKIIYLIQNNHGKLSTCYAYISNFRNKVISANSLKKYWHFQCLAYKTCKSAGMYINRKPILVFVEYVASTMNTIPTYDKKNMYSNMVLIVYVYTTNIMQSVLWNIKRKTRVYHEEDSASELHTCFITLHIPVGNPKIQGILYTFLNDLVSFS